MHLNLEGVFSSLHKKREKGTYPSFAVLPQKLVEIGAEGI